MWGSEFFFERRCCTTRGDGGGAQAIVRGGARCVSQVALAVYRGAARWSSQVLDRGAHVDAEAPRMYFIVVYRLFPAAPLVVRCMYMAVSHSRAKSKFARDNQNATNRDMEF